MNHEHTESERASGRPFESALTLGRSELAAIDPWDAARRSGTTYEQLNPSEGTSNEPAPSHRAGRFEVRLWDRSYSIYHPEGSVRDTETGEEPAVAIQIILLHYLAHADGTRPQDEWIAFRQLPGGHAYERAFHQRVNLPLGTAFDANSTEMAAAAEVMGGTSLSFGDVSYLFRTLPHLRMAAVFYRGDEEFPASANVLFDGAASHCLPTEDLAVLGEILAERILQGT